MEPLISIIVNCHNGEKYLKECISSILNQKYQNFEVIFFNNSSKDNSKKIIDNFQSNKIRYFYSSEKLSLYKARNEALKHARGELIAYLDSDDWWNENYLSSRLEHFKNKHFDFFYCNSNFFFEKNKKKKIYKNYSLPSGKIYSFLIKDYFIIISGVIFRKEIFQKYGKFNENFNIIGDYDFLMRISIECNAHALNSPLINYRVHENNFSKMNTKMYYEEYKFWLEENKKTQNDEFNKNIHIHEMKLEYFEIAHLLKESKKDFFLFKKIIRYNNFSEKIKFLILFFLPKRIHKFLKK